MNKSKIDWKAEIKGGYVGNDAPDGLKEEVKTMDRIELEERYLDAIVRFCKTQDELNCMTLDANTPTPRRGQGGNR